MWSRGALTFPSFDHGTSLIHTTSLTSGICCKQSNHLRCLGPRKNKTIKNHIQNTCHTHGPLQCFERFITFTGFKASSFKGGGGVNGQGGWAGRWWTDLLGDVPTASLHVCIYMYNYHINPLNTPKISFMAYLVAKPSYPQGCVHFPNIEMLQAAELLSSPPALRAELAGALMGVSEVGEAQVTMDFNTKARRMDQN